MNIKQINYVPELNILKVKITVLRDSILNDTVGIPAVIRTGDDTIKNKLQALVGSLELAHEDIITYLFVSQYPKTVDAVDAFTYLDYIIQIGTSVVSTLHCVASYISQAVGANNALMKDLMEFNSWCGGEATRVSEELGAHKLNNKQTL